LIRLFFYAIYVFGSASNEGVGVGLCIGSTSFPSRWKKIGTDS